MAATITEQQTIHGVEAAQVFDFVATIENFPVWADAVVEASAPQPLAVGVDITSVSSMMGLKIRGTQTVRTFDPPHRFAYGGDDPFPSSFEWIFEQQGPDVVVTLTCVIAPKGLPGGDKVVGRFIKRQISGMVGNVVRRFEQR